MRFWHGYLSEARRRWFAYGPADATAILASLASLKFRMVWPFWCSPIQVVLERRLLNGCLSVYRSTQQVKCMVTLAGNFICEAVSNQPFVFYFICVVQSSCVYVCLSARSHIPKTTCPHFTKLSVRVTHGHAQSSSDDNTLLCISSFVNDFISTWQRKYRYRLGVCDAANCSPWPAR